MLKHLVVGRAWVVLCGSICVFLCVLGLHLGAINSQILQILRVHQLTSEDYVGSWVNSDPRTRGIAKLTINVEGGTLTVRIWAVCKHQDCDWGPSRGTISAGKLRTNLDQGFVTRSMNMVRRGDILTVTTESVYRDDRDRFQQEDHFYRQGGMIVGE